LSFVFDCLDDGIINMKNLLFLLTLSALISPLSAKKKPKTPLVPTQPDIVRGCIAVRGITFQRATTWHPVDVHISGSITNNCEKDALVTIDAAFFDTNGIKTDEEVPQQLVPTNSERPFNVRANVPEGRLSAGYQAAQYRDGRIISVTAQLQP
jgi:hypothetical protein